MILLAYAGYLSAQNMYTDAYSEGISDGYKQGIARGFNEGRKLACMVKPI